MGVCWESSLASLPREPPMSIGGIIIRIYCAVRYFGYGDDRCFARGGKVLYKLYEMAGAMIKKLFMSSASSAIGTGTGGWTRVGSQRRTGRKCKLRQPPVA